MLMAYQKAPVPRVARVRPRGVPAGSRALEVVEAPLPPANEGLARADALRDDPVLQSLLRMEGDPGAGDEAVRGGRAAGLPIGRIDPSPGDPRCVTSESLGRRVKLT